MKKYSDIISKFIPKKSIIRGLKNASYLIIGNFLSMVINFFGFVFIARLLGPSDYGIYDRKRRYLKLCYQNPRKEAGFRSNSNNYLYSDSY